MARGSVWVSTKNKVERHAIWGTVVLVNSLLRTEPHYGALLITYDQRRWIYKGRRIWEY